MSTTEQKATHTPGPWRWMDYPDGRKLLLSRDRAVIHCPDAPMTCDLADARLIVAAPDLLAALKSLTAWLGDKSVEGDTIGSLQRKLADAARAIAKAEAR